MAQLGLIYAIPEDLFDVASATIIDVTFLGFMPKTIFEAMRTYGYTVDRDKASDKFKNLCEHTSILRALIKYPQGNLEEIQQKTLQSPGGTWSRQDHKA
jgi:hypothetical protein